MLGVAVAEPVLDKPKVLPLVGESVTAGMAQHVGVDVAEAGPLASFSDDVVDGAADHLAIALRDEQPWQLVIASGEIALDRSELIARERLFGVQ